MVRVSADRDYLNLIEKMVDSHNNNNNIMSSLLVLLALLVIGCNIVSASGTLIEGYYDPICPQAEDIVNKYVNSNINPALAAKLLRMHFHDCFVKGCDGSVLLKTEREAIPNLSLRGFEFIDDLKLQLEDECPGVVSCADIISLVARDAIVAIGGPYWRVPTGRLDGTIAANGTEVLTELPAPFANFSVLQEGFARKGLNVEDLVLLSGAHTIGVAHCLFVEQRLYNFTGVGDSDPSLDSHYATQLRERCKPNDTNTSVAMDPGSVFTFDLRRYYDLLLEKKGFFMSDSALTTDATSSSFVMELLASDQQTLYKKFAGAMEKLGRIGEDFGGEVRRHCGRVN